MNKDKRHILSVDIGGSKLMSGIVGYDGSILAKEKILLKVPISEEYLVGKVIDAIKYLLAKCKNIYIDCIGVAVPGIADSFNGTMLFAPYSGIKNFEIGRILEENFNVPVFIENDANACAYGEMMFGACKNVKNFVWITVSNGIGGAIVIDKHLYEGEFKGAGEIGHINVVEEGFECGCGNKGCLEAYASGPGIVRRYYEKNLFHNKEETAKTIAQFAKNGEEIALEVYRETGYYLGKVISYIVNLLNPEKIILGGGISMDMDLFLPELKRVLNSMIFKLPNKGLSIEKTALLYDASLIGVAAVAIIRTGGIII